MPCIAEKGISASPTISGAPHDRRGAKTASACAAAPVQHQTMPQTGRPRSSSGKGAVSGTVVVATNPPISSGSVGRVSRKKRITAAVSARS